MALANNDAEYLHGRMTMDALSKIRDEAMSTAGALGMLYKRSDEADPQDIIHLLKTIREHAQRPESAVEKVRLRYENEELKKKVQRLRDEVAKQSAMNEARNAALDALGWVWCSGGCPAGTMRTTDGASLTSGMLVALLKNTGRALTWWMERHGAAKMIESADVARKLMDLCSEQIQSLTGGADENGPEPWVPAHVAERIVEALRKVTIVDECHTAPPCLSLRAELTFLDQQEKAIEVRRAQVYQRSKDAPADEKVCDDVTAEILGDTDLFGRFSYPVWVHGITHNQSSPIGRGWRSRPAGAWVAIRPVDDKRTYLGVYLGDIATSVGVSYHPQTGVLETYTGRYNPAIWVPDLGRVVFGVESWWGVVKSPEDLQQITDQDIENVWYVRALRELQQRPEECQKLGDEAERA